MRFFIHSLKNSYHKEKLLWFIFYPFIAISFIFIGNDNHWRELIKLPSFISDIFFALVVTFLTGFYIQWLTQKLDERFSWHDTFAKRLFKQLTLGIVLPLIVTMLLEMLYLQIIEIPIANSSIFNLELPLCFLFLLLIHSFYLIRFLFHHQNPAVSTPSAQFSPMEKEIEYLTVQKGSTEQQIAIEACAFLMTSQKVLWLYTYQGAQYRLQGTLEEWESKLKSANFYRINRQYLAAAKAIHSIEQTETRKLKVNFVIPAEEVYVSKLNAARFKQWWKETCPS